MERGNLRRIIVAASAAVFLILAGLVLFRPAKVREPAGQPPEKTAVPAKPKLKGRIAIVIDDVGYSSANFEVLEKIGHPLTLSVLPNLPFSAQACERFHKRFQIMLHLPMEPRNTTGLEKDTILCGMDSGQVSDIIGRDLAGLKYARGVNNHMGSRVTEDPVTLKLIFAELKKRRLFFLDSFVTPRSVAKAEAASAGIKTGRRDIFLDNKSDPAYIRRQLAQLKQKAKDQGSAIGIGHDRKNTIKALQEEMPRIAGEGFRFVHVSELLK